MKNKSKGQEVLERHLKEIMPKIGELIAGTAHPAIPVQREDADLGRSHTAGIQVAFPIVHDDGQRYVFRVRLQVMAEAEL